LKVLADNKGDTIMSTTEDIKALARRLPLEGFNEGKTAAFDEVVAIDANDHLPPPGLPPGREGYKRFIAILHAAFPDIHYTVCEEVAEGDMMMHHTTARGTHRGEFLGIPPTGRQIRWDEMHILRFANGQAVEHWGNIDQLSILQQLGVIPAAG
jgi:predicted ester cyclase